MNQNKAKQIIISITVNQIIMSIIAKQRETNLLRNQVIYTKLKIITILYQRIIIRIRIINKPTKIINLWKIHLY